MSDKSMTSARGSGPVARKMNRRTFLQQTTAATMALGVNALGVNAFGASAFSVPKALGFLENASLGIVVHSYSSRWHSEANSAQYPGFSDAIDLLNHCHQLGVGGAQVGVNDWSKDFARQVRQTKEKLGLYVEGSISLPKDANEREHFEERVKTAREAGVELLRTVCLSGRRYENFQSAEEFAAFKKNSLASLQIAEPIVRKHTMKLAVENHKDWRAPELVEIMQQLDSEWIGVTLDFGNSISLLEDPMEVVRKLVPYVFTTHMKDMAVEEYADGFLLSEVPLGEGILDLPQIVALCKKHNPTVAFNLEMITRDPLEVPCLSEDYWTTFATMPASDLARTLRMVRQHPHPTALPRVTPLSTNERLAVEEKNVVASLAYGKRKLALT